MGKRPHILVLTLSFGAGHVRAAEAIAAELRHELPGADIRMVDAMGNCRTLFRAFYVWPYWAMIRYAPSLWKTFFESRVSAGHDHTAPLWALRWGFATTFEFIESFQPDLIVACEVGASEVSVIARREKLTDAKIINVVTDFEAEPIWVKPEVEAFVVADDQVKRQLQGWRAESGKIRICGIPLGSSFDREHEPQGMRRDLGLDDRPIVLLMGGGMGPTRMDSVAAKLLESRSGLQILALPGRDKKALRRLKNLKSSDDSTLQIIGWTNDVANLMQVADLLVTKPGGVTLAEAAASGLPLILFDPIPGPETANAQKFVQSGAAVLSSDSTETARAVTELLRDKHKLDEMAHQVTRLARPKAASKVAQLSIEILSTETRERSLVWTGEKGKSNRDDRPILILTISNGAGHRRTAQGIAADIRKYQPSVPVVIADVAEYMTPLAKFTHIQAYLWLVKHAPGLWNLIDRYQKKQTTTSPEWFYRRGCRRLFDLASEVQPRAIVATEVGCCEIASLIKRDLILQVPLVAVHTDLDADRAWIKPEVDLYCLVTDDCAREFIQNGAPRDRVVAWGAPLAEGFDKSRDRKMARAEVCRWLGLDPAKPIILVAGGGEGIGRVEETTRTLLQLDSLAAQIIVLTGRNERLKTRCDLLALDDQDERLRVLGWTDPQNMPKLMQAADLMVSKLGNMFYEAIATGLPIVAMEPPPGGEREQYRLLSEWNVGRAVRTKDEMVLAVTDLLKTPDAIAEIREQMLLHKNSNAGIRIVNWLTDKELNFRSSVEETLALIGLSSLTSDRKIDCVSV